MLITTEQRKNIILLGYQMIGERYPSRMSCAVFVKDLYRQVGLSVNFMDYPILPFSEIKDERVVGLPIFLRRRKTKSLKRITHIGIIFPDEKILHYSRWMQEDMEYQVFLSSFEEVFEIYEFV